MYILYLYLFLEYFIDIIVINQISHSPEGISCPAKNYIDMKPYFLGNHEKLTWKNIFLWEEDLSHLWQLLTSCFWNLLETCAKQALFFSLSRLNNHVSLFYLKNIFKKSLIPHILFFTQEANCSSSSYTQTHGHFCGHLSMAMTHDLCSINQFDLGQCIILLFFLEDWNKCIS